MLTVFLPYIQIALAILLTAGILLQQSAAGLGGAFGDNFSSAYHTRRGFEKIVFNSTVVIAILFVISTVVALFIRN